MKYIFTQKNLNVRQRTWLKLWVDYDVYIVYHEDKENVVVDALSRQSVWRVVSFVAIRVEQNNVDRGLITMMVKMTIEVSGMDCIRIGQ